MGVTVNSNVNTLAALAQGQRQAARTGEIAIITVTIIRHGEGEADTRIRNNQNVDD